MTKRPFKGSAKAPPKEAASMFKVKLGQVDCAPFTFANAEDTRVYAEVEQLLEKLRLNPTAEVLAAAQHKLMELREYPTVVAVVAGRFPLLFSALAQFAKDLGAANAEPMSVAGMKWDVRCRSVWLSNACAVEDIGDQALAILAPLPQLLRSFGKDGDDIENEVWSVLHLFSWALRCSAIGGSIATFLESCEELWMLVESEVVKAEPHDSAQLVLLDLLSALGLHVAFSAALRKRLLVIAGKLTRLPLPVHFHTAVKLYYGCAVAEQEDEDGGVEKALDALHDAWERMTQQSAVIPPALQAAKWIFKAEAMHNLKTAIQLHRFLSSRCNGPALDVEAVMTFRKKACELPAALRAFCVHALPGNPLLWLHRALVNTPKPQLVTAITDTLADVVLDGAPEIQTGESTGATHVCVDKNTYTQLCLQQLWVSGMSVSLSGLLNKRDAVITAAVVRLLEWMAIHTSHDNSTRRVLLGAPSISHVADVLAGVAESDAVKEELKKKAVRAVVDHAFCLVCALDHAELTSVFNDTIVMSTSTLITEGKDDPVLLQHGLRALAHLAAAFPMAASVALDFDFLAEQCTNADSPAVSAGALIVGSLNVMSAIVLREPTVVTFEWIEILLGTLQNLDGWRHSVPDLDAALWRCVRHTVDASADCNEYLFTAEMENGLRNELGSLKCERAHLDSIMPSLLAIASRMQPSEYPHVYAATQEAITRVPAELWTQDMCDAALHFLVTSYPLLDSHQADEATARCTTTAAVAVLYGAAHSHLHLTADACANLARGISKKGLITNAMTALFDLADDAAAVLVSSGAVAIPCEATKLCSAVLPLLHNLFVTCPTTRSPAAEERVQRISSVLARAPSSAFTPQLHLATLLLVEDTCSCRTHSSVTTESVKMQQVWTVLMSITQQAADKKSEEAWRAVLSRTYAVAHQLFLAFSAVPIVDQSDPRLSFVGKCGLPHVAMEECAALLQTVLNNEDARASLRRDYGESYTVALRHIANTVHHSSGIIPLSLQRYHEETKQN
uniref:Uncharacterized protein n=1 Tax=Leishmania guyanensis TaxID=5670 RepID=A0A1E1J596_LEIGU|nr:hypothetical protein, conserved [Leishmania guyanensis]